MLTSNLFRGDPLLQAVADDHDRISRIRHQRDPAVKKVQLALLDWDPGCLPASGADGVYGRETAAAVHKFKVDELHVPEGSVVDDVGPQTVLRLDALQTARDGATPVTIDPDPDRSRVLDEWLGPPLDGWSSEVSTSSVVAHVSGDAAFASLADALDRCVTEAALVLISGWDFHPNTPLRPGLSVGDALTAAAGRGARVRALLAHFPEIDLGVTKFRPVAGDNTAAVAFVNALPNGAAIHDDWVLHHVVPGALTSRLGPVQIGIHHQKAWVVFDGTRTTAWCGGIDINPNRSSLATSDPLHDVQAQLDGPAAAHLYDLLAHRGNDHPAAASTGVTLPALPPGPSRAAEAVAVAPQRARIVATFGDPRQFAGLGRTPGTPPYPFAPAGSKAIRDQVFHAIAKAERFIYLEDQYLVDEEVAARLAAALPRLRALVIVICHSDTVNGELHQAWERHKRFLDHLAPHMGKVAVLVGHGFIHAKVWIVDDQVAVVSSANVNRRGFRHDSEVGVAFGDQGAPGQVQRLRQQLWAAHLGGAAPDPAAPPEDSLALWQAPPGGASVSPYPPYPPAPPPSPGDHNTTIPGFSADETWDIIDPDCP